LLNCFDLLKYKIEVEVINSVDSHASLNYTQYPVPRWLALQVVRSERKRAKLVQPKITL
jgi:hypothetical protein